MRWTTAQAPDSVCEMCEPAIWSTSKSGVKIAGAMTAVAALLLGGCCSPKDPRMAKPAGQTIGGGPVFVHAADGEKPAPPLLIPVPERRGYYYAPDDRAKRPIDARGFPPGTDVVSPYSQRVYRVPETAKPAPPLV
jgi:hypothetical protein